MVCVKTLLEMVKDVEILLVKLQRSDQQRHGPHCQLFTCGSGYSLLQLQIFLIETTEQAFNLCT